MNILLGSSRPRDLSPSFLSELKAQGHVVRCIPNDLSNDAFAKDHSGTDHIQLARWAELIWIFDADAEWITRAAQGSGGDFLLLQLLATQSRVRISCAIPTPVWENPVLQTSVASLRARGFRVDRESAPHSFHIE